MKKFAKFIPWICVVVVLAICAVVLFSCLGQSSNDPDPTGTGATDAPANGPFTVTFDLNGTELKTTKVQPQTVQKGEVLRMPEVFVIGENPDNWSIVGWYMEPECEVEWDFDVDIVESDMTLYAKWKADRQVTVTYFAGKDAESLQQVHTAKVSLGLSAERCDERVVGYEVLGYYADAEFTTEYDFDAAVNADTTVYIKTSDYIYLSPSYLSTFGMTGVTHTLAPDGSSITLSYTAEWNEKENRYVGDTYIFNKAINADTNGYDHFEIVYKVENADRVNTYWFGTHSDGTAILGLNDFSNLLANAGVAEFGLTTWVDAEGWTHAVYDMTRVNTYYQQGAERLSDIANLGGFRIDLDMETAELATLTIKYVKGSKGPEGANITYYVDGKIMSDEFVPAGGKPAGYPRPGRKITYYTDKAMTKVYDITKAPTKDINLYLDIDEDHVWFDGLGLMNFKPVADASTKLSGNGNLIFSGPNGGYIYHKELGLKLNGDNMLEIKAKLDGCTPGMYLYGAYTLNGKAGATTDYGQDYTRLTALCQVTDLGDGWSLVTVDLTKIAAGFQLESIEGLRLDIYGEGKYNAEIEYVKSYRFNKHTVTMVIDGNTYTEAVDDGKFVSGVSMLGKNLAYYTDKAMTKPFDLLTPITSDITLYVKVLDHLYFSGAALNQFNTMGGAELTLNPDGTLTVSGGNGAYIYRKDLNLAMNGDNMLEIRVKMDGANPGIWLFGKYTVNGVAGESTDYGQDHTRVPADATSVKVDGDWATITIDLSQMAPGFQLDVLNGLRFDIYGTDTYDVTIDYIRSYCVLRHTVTFVQNGQTTMGFVNDGDKITTVGILGKKVSYYTDKACTKPFDINTPITKDTTVYVVTSEGVYFDGTALNRFNATDGTVTLNKDGSLTLAGPNGAYLYKKNLGLTMDGHNMLRIKLKSNTTNMAIWVCGKYSINGTAGESTDFGQDHTRIPAEAITTTTEGEWTVLTVDFSKVTDGYVLNVMNGFRLDLYGDGQLSATYHSVESFLEEKCTVTYKGDVNKTEVLAKGGYITGSAILGRKVEYFSDAACTKVFDITQPITKDVTVYVKVGTHVYFNGQTLDAFIEVADAVSTVNPDGTLTVTGPNGAYIYRKELNLAMNGDNVLRIKLKSNTTNMGIWVCGKYRINGTAGESTDFGQDHTRIPAEAITTTTEGEWTVLTVDFSKVTDGYVLNVMNGFRLDLYGTGDLTATYHTVESYREDKYTVTFKGDVDTSDTVFAGNTINTNLVAGREELFFTDAACTVPYDVTTAVNSNLTLYVKLSEYVYINGQDIKDKSNKGPEGTVNADGNFVIQPGSALILNWKMPEALTTGGNTKFEVRFKLTNYTGTEVAFFTQGTLSDGSGFGENGVYVPLSGDGWHTVTFDFATKLNGAKFSTMQQFRFDVYGCTADTVVEIDYMKSVTDETVDPPAGDFTVTYAGAATGTEQVANGATANGVKIDGREEFYYTDEACTVPYDLATPVTGDITVYVKASEYTYINGQDIKDKSNKGPEGTVNADGNFVIQPGSALILNWKMSEALTTGGNTKFEVRFKLTNYTGTQVAFFTQGTLVGGGTLGETGVYVPLSGDGWHTVTFDFATNLNGTQIEKMQQFRLDVYGCTADTVVEIDYMKSVKETVTYDVTYEGDKTGTETVNPGDCATGVDVLGREVLYFTDSACTQAFDLSTPITAPITLYVKVSEYVYVNGADIHANFAVASPSGISGTVNEDGNFVIQPGNASLILNWKPSALTTGGNTKFEVRFKLTGYTGTQIAFFTEGTLSGGATVNEGQTGMYQSMATLTAEDGWYTVVFDCAAKLASSGYAGQTFTSIQQFRFDVYGCTADTVVEIDYMKSVSDAVAPPASEFTVTYAGAATGTETVASGETANGVKIQGREELYFTDSACTQAFDLNTPITASITLYVKASEYVYVNGADIQANFTVASPSGISGTVNEDGNFVIQPGNASLILNWKPSALTTGGNTKFEVRFKLTGYTGTQIAFFTEGTLSGGATVNEGQTGMYQSMATLTAEDGWYTVVFDCAAKLASSGYAGQTFTSIQQFRFDVYGCTADTVVEIDYMKSVSDAVAPPASEFTVTYAGAATGTETVASGETAKGVEIALREELYFKDEACTEPFDLSTPITENMTLYVKASENVYLTGTEIKANFTNTTEGTVDADGYFVIEPGSNLILNWRPTGLTTGGNTKFEVRFKLENHGSQVALFTRGALNNGGSLGETGVYYGTNADGWYTVTFDFSSKLTGANAGALLTAIDQIRFDINGASANTILTIDYIKTVTE